MKTNRIKKKDEFSNVFNNGKSIVVNSFILKYAKKFNKEKIT